MALSVLVFSGLGIQESAHAAVPTSAFSSVLLVSTFSGTGSGVVVGKGLILTANHVVKGTQHPGVQTQGTSTRQKSTVIYRDSGTDLALLSAPSVSLPQLGVLGHNPSLGSEVFAVGDPGGMFSVTRGVVSAFPILHTVAYVQTDAAVNPGNSGGPILNDDGLIVGLVVQKSLSQEGVGLAVAPGEITQFLSDARAIPSTSGTSTTSNPSTSTSTSITGTSSNTSGSGPPSAVLWITLGIGGVGIIVWITISIMRRRRTDGATPPPMIVLGRVLPPEKGEADGDT